MKKKLVFIFFIMFYMCFVNVGFAQNIENISYDDFLLDKDLLKGKTITIKGFCRNPHDVKYYLYKSDEFEDRSRVINLNISELSKETKEWLSKESKNGLVITLKAIVEDYGLKVLEIQEASNYEQVNTNINTNTNQLQKKTTRLIYYDDFLLDKDSYIGKIITINGFCRNNINDKYFLFKSDQIEDRSKAIRLSTTKLSRNSRKWLLENCKKGVFITIKAVVGKHDLIVLKIKEANDEQINKNDECVNYDDFIIDKDSYIGKKIKIKGFCRNLYDDKYYLYKSDFFADRLNSISLSISDLPREERKWLLQNCKKGHFIIVKAIVEKYGLKVLKIEKDSGDNIPSKEEQAN